MPHFGLWKTTLRYSNLPKNDIISFSFLRSLADNLYQPYSLRQLAPIKLGTPGPPGLNHSTQQKMNNLFWHDENSDEQCFAAHIVQCCQQYWTSCWAWIQPAIRCNNVKQYCWQPWTMWAAKHCSILFSSGQNRLFIFGCVVTPLWSGIFFGFPGWKYKLRVTP